MLYSVKSLIYMVPHTDSNRGPTDYKTLEDTMHQTLKNRGKHINEEGTEWFMTNVGEIVEILRFNHLIV